VPCAVWVLHCGQTVLCGVHPNFLWEEAVGCAKPNIHASVAAIKVVEGTKCMLFEGTARAVHQANWCAAASACCSPVNVQQIVNAALKATVCGPHARSLAGW
jgi:hypothetical protein